LFLIKFNIEKILIFLAAPYQYFNSIMATIWSTYMTTIMEKQHVNISTKATSVHKSYKISTCAPIVLACWSIKEHSLVCLLDIVDGLG
jgi:hypothetical protein